MNKGKPLGFASGAPKGGRVGFPGVFPVVGSWPKDALFGLERVEITLALSINMKSWLFGAIARSEGPIGVVGVTD